MPLEQRMQAQLCLTAAHPRCERFIAHMARADRARPAAVFGDGLVSTRMLVAPEPVWRGIAGRARQAPRGPVIAGALAVAALGVGAAAVTAAALDGRLDFALVTPTDSVAASPAASVHEASAAATPRPTPRPSATPTASASGSSAPSPSLAATPAPTLAATPAPEPPQVTPAPPPTQQTYTVQEGDTLALIAEQFGTTVDALQAANGIEEPDEIVIGQVLVIP